jgi:phage shock protein A
MRQLLPRMFDIFIDVYRQTLSPLASLDRSLAAAYQSHMAARRALAIAIAEEAREAERRRALMTKTQDLEQRAVEALRAGRDDLATQAAEAIAAMSGDISATELASRHFAAEVALARREVEAQRRRLSDLDRGRRMARIDSALTGTIHGSETGLDSLSEAEIALEKVRADNQNARAIRHEMSQPAEHLIERMSEAGFGRPTHIRASDVLARLRRAAEQPVATLIESNPKS